MIERLLVLALVACGGSKTPLAVDAPNPSPDAATDATAARDPADDGAFAIAMTTASIPGAMQGRTLPATVFAPTTGTMHPLVVVSAGFQMDRAQYASYARHLATWGFVVVLADYADRGFFADHSKLAGDITAVIDWAIANQAVDAQRIAVAGHSLGGKLSVFAASQDPRVRAVVAWDPVDSSNPSVVPEKLSTLGAAIAVIGETTNGGGGGMPCAPAAENFLQFYAAAPSPAIAVTVAGADHMDWVDDPSCGFCGFCTPGTIDPELVRRATRRLDVAWLRRQLDNDLTMDVWLDSPPDVGLTVMRR